MIFYSPNCCILRPVNPGFFFLGLAPVDPRSLMQGDYMALRFQLARSLYADLPKVKSEHWRQPVKAGDGYVVVLLDERNFATYRGLYQDQKLAENELLLYYRVRQGRVKFATNACYFQEGHAGILNRFAMAAFGSMNRVNYYWSVCTMNNLRH